MNSLSIVAAILLWGTQVTPIGSITGTITALTGGPAAGVRVVAIAIPQDAQQADTTTFESIAQTDSNGRYRLENVSPGRYYIAAGPVNFQTFVPGTPDRGNATVVQITKESLAVALKDFTIGTATATDIAKGFTNAAVGTVSCCNLDIKFLMEDKSAVPDFPILVVIDRRSRRQYTYRAARNRSLGEGPTSIQLPLNSTAEIAVDQLAPGYVLKSVAYGGKSFGLGPIPIDGKGPAVLELTLGYDLAAISKKVTVRGTALNPPTENKQSIRLFSTLPNGLVLTTGIQPDGSFEFSNIPTGAYWTGGFSRRGRPGPITGPAGSSVIAVDGDISDLTIDLLGSPFPELVNVRPDLTPFANRQSTELTGVITGQLWTITTTGISYFRMDVKDPATGAVKNWAIFVEKPGLVPQLVVGETVTVPGVLANDGTNRFSAYPF